MTPILLSEHKLASLTKLSSSFLKDANFDIQTYLVRDFSRRFGRAEESACQTGDGIDQPVGILSSAEVGVTAGSATAISYDEILQLYFSLAADYRPNAVFVMSDETALALRMLKDNSGRYLWNDANDTIFNRPVIVTPRMPQITTGAKPVLFTDLSFFWLIEVRPISVQRLVELYIQQGYIAYQAQELLDYKLLRPDAAKTLVMA